MNKTQKKRLRELLAKAEDTRSADENKELLKLINLATKEKYDYEAADASLDDTKGADEGDENEPLTPDEVTTLVSEGVTKSLKAIGLDPESVTAIKTAIEAKGAGGATALTASVVEEIVTKHLGGQSIDKDALIADVKAAAIEAAAKNKGVSEDQVKTVVEAALTSFMEKNVRSGAKNVFPLFGGGQSAAPIEHRSGNMTVGQKQLLNLCLMHVSEDSIAACGSSRPKGINDGIAADQLTNAVRQGELHAKSVRHEVIYGKALTTTGTGTGGELMPSDLSGDLQARLYLESMIAAEFASSEIDMPTNPFTFPLITTRPTFKKGSEAPGSDPDASEPGTGEIVFNAKKLIGMSEYSYESNEDAIISILPMLTEQMAAAAADALETALLNGDTAASQDSDVTAGDAETLFNGLRKLALAVASLKMDLSTGGLSAANILAMKKAMGKYGMKQRDLLLIPGVSGYNDLIGLSETLTAEKVGNTAARILTGDAPSLYGIRIIASDRIRENLNASGVYDGVTTTKGSVLLVHRPSFMLGVRRGFLVEVDVDKKRQVNSVVASFRRDFVPKETPSATVKSVVVGYNYNA